MSKLTKSEINLHDNALELLKRTNLTDDEICFVLENYREGANHINSKAGAFFTPMGLARDLALHIPFGYNQAIKIVDLCAGIGALSYAASISFNNWNRCPLDITCIEINPDYVEIGKKLLPDAHWICGDVLDPDFLNSLGHFDFAISNPPFGSIKSTHRHSYLSSQFEYMVIEAAAKISDGGTFLIPQMRAPFIYSGTNNHRWLDNCSARGFEQKTGITLEFNAGIDTVMYKNDWHGVAPTCEIVCCDFTERVGQISIETVA